MGHPGASSSRRLASRRSLQGCLSSTTDALARFGIFDTEIRRYLVTTTTAPGPPEVFPEPHAVRYLGQTRTTQAGSSQLGDTVQDQNLPPRFRLQRESAII